MYPILFRIGPVTIYSYGLMLALAFVLATLLAKKEAIKNGFAPDLIVDLAGYILVAGIVGARLLYVVLNLDEYKRSPFEILMLQRGGLSFYGGAVAGFLVCIWFARRRKFSFLRIADLFSPFIALGHAIGRIGCLLRGCCFGRETTAGLRIRFPDEVVYRHPTQVYASVVGFLIFLSLRYFYRKRHFDGRIFLLYLMFYSLERFLLDFLRADVAPAYLGLTIVQNFSLLVFILSFLTLLFKQTKNLKDE